MDIIIIAIIITIILCMLINAFFWALEKLLYSETCEVLGLLHNLSVLEYENEENWCDIHPTLEALLTK